MLARVEELLVLVHCPARRSTRQVGCPTSSTPAPSPHHSRGTVTCLAAGFGRFLLSPARAGTGPRAGGGAPGRGPGWRSAHAGVRRDDRCCTASPSRTGWRGGFGVCAGGPASRTWWATPPCLRGGRHSARRGPGIAARPSRPVAPAGACGPARGRPAMPCVGLGYDLPVTVRARAGPAAPLQLYPMIIPVWPGRLQYISKVGGAYSAYWK
jgi:hypothetical protein